MILSETQVERLNEYQDAGFYHPFTCGSGKRTDERHADGEGKLLATPEGWVCKFCDYRQGYSEDGLEMKIVESDGAFEDPFKVWIDNFNKESS